MKIILSVLTLARRHLSSVKNREGATERARILAAYMAGYNRCVKDEHEQIFRDWEFTYVPPKKRTWSSPAEAAAWLRSGTP